jgi:hypothetical protein
LYSLSRVSDSVQAGAAAGICVDLSLFPVDTIKTRLQSEKGFLGAGGFRGLYNGIGSPAVGAMPGGTPVKNTCRLIFYRELVPSCSLFRRL